MADQLSVSRRGVAEPREGELCVMRKTTFRLPVTWLAPLAAVVALSPAMMAQKTQSEPVTDSAAQASPIRPAPPAPVDDSAAQASPVSSGNGHGVSIAPHTSIEVRLGRSIDSGHLKNGDTVAATLAKPVALSPKGTLDTGTKAELTVVETLPAGLIYAAGEFSLQLEREGPVGVYTNTLTYRGEPGHKDLPDSAPAVGTDAGLPAGAEIVFHVLPPPQAVNGPPKAANGGPGSVNGVANGASPPPGSSKQAASQASQKPGSGKTNASQAKSITPAATTPQSAEDLGKSSPAPNQPAPPSGASSTQTTQPHP